MTDTPLYNTRIINSYVEYLKRYLPDIDIAPLLKYAEIETYQLNDEGHWLTQKQSDRFHEMLVQMTQDQNIARKVGRFSTTSRASGALGQYLLGCEKELKINREITTYWEKLTRASAGQPS